jgi:hypothetical protein
MHVWCFGYSNFMPGRGGVGAVMALTFAAFWLVVVFAEVEEPAAEEEIFLLTEVEAETTVLETTTAAEVLTEAATEDFLVEEAIDFAGGTEEAGLDGGFADEGALEETFDGALEGALEGAFAASEAGLALLVTVLVEVPLMAVTVLVTTISLPLAVES